MLIFPGGALLNACFERIFAFDHSADTVVIGYDLLNPKGFRFYPGFSDPGIEDCINNTVLLCGYKQ